MVSLLKRSFGSHHLHSVQQENSEARLETATYGIACLILSLEADIEKEEEDTQTLILRKFMYYNTRRKTFCWLDGVKPCMVKIKE